MGVNVREKPKGSGVWWVFINHQGKRKAKKIGKDKKIASEVAKKIEAKLVLGDLDIEKEREVCPLFRDYAELWLSLRHNWKESTRENYIFNLKLHILPVFGNYRIDEIRRRDLKTFFDRLISERVSSGTASLIRTPLNAILAYAEDSELIERNPMTGLKLIARNKNSQEIVPLTEEEASVFLEHGKEYLTGAYYPLFLCALRTGMRIGELQALKWEDIHFDRRQIEVSRSFRKNRISDTKNKKRRRVDMTQHLTETLKNLQTAQKKIALKNGRPFSQWVFATKKGEIFEREAFKNALHRCLQQAGLRRIRVHDLRHSYATIRLLKGHNVGDVSYQLGHSSIRITYDVYVHWIPGKFKSEVDELDEQPSATYTQPKIRSL